VEHGDADATDALTRVQPVASLGVPCASWKYVEARHRLSRRERWRWGRDPLRPGESCRLCV